MYDIDTDNDLAEELVKFDEMFDRISRNKEIYVEGNSYLVNIFYDDESVYEINLLREKAEEVEKYLKEKLNIQ